MAGPACSSVFSPWLVMGANGATCHVLLPKTLSGTQSREPSNATEISQTVSQNGQKLMISGIFFFLEGLESWPTQVRVPHFRLEKEDPLGEGNAIQWGST